MSASLERAPPSNKRPDLTAQNQMSTPALTRVNMVFTRNFKKFLKHLIFRTPHFEHFIILFQNRNFLQETLFFKFTYLKN